MTESELQDWLVETSIYHELQQLGLVTALLELDNVSKEPSLENVEFDWPRLLFAASILARSEKRVHKEASLRIATGAMLLPTSDPVRDAAAVLFDKLSNHRSAVLAEQRGRLRPNLGSRLGIGLRLEDQRRQLDSSVLLEASGERLAVNDFQLKFWSAAAEDRAWLSASAPTASGKTFLVLKWLVDSLGADKVRRAVYLAPTRALVSEIEASLSQIISQSGLDVEVTSLPSAQKYSAATKDSKKCVFVFTQERLHLLANLMKEQLDIDLVVVDEAHKIGDPQRGVILQDAIERLLRSSPHMRVAFVSPATQNPEVLLEDAPESTPTRAVDSDVATVLQNIIVAHQVPAKPTKWALEFRHGEEYLPIGTLTLPSKPNTMKKRLAFIAASVGQRGGTLVYANGAADAEEVALLISQFTEKTEAVDQELADLADLARKCVHKNYMLAPLVERGVAFHYGNMPSLVRLEIERLFRTGKLKFLVCTSTLIEGVNLSCRTIVVRGPKKGKRTPMEPQDFWNLAGRAGRWGDEFQGNIICIDASNEDVWPSGVPQRTRYPIRRETDAALSKLDALMTYIADRPTADALNADQVRTLEQVSAYLATTYMRERSFASAPWAKRKSEEDLRKLEDVLAQATAGMDVRPEIGTRNPGVSLFGLQRLMTYFRRYTGPPEDLLLAPSESDDAYDRFTEIMERLNEHVLPVFLPGTLIPLHALIVLEWMKGFSLPTIIRKRIEYLQRRGTEFDTAQVIRNTLELIEGTARFLAPRYFSAYVDVLNQHLQEIGREDLIDHDLDIGVALEFGVTSITMRSLMELGMSRISAVALYEVIALDGLDEHGCIQWVTERRDQLDSIGLPAIVVREVRERVLVKVPLEGN
ncbi:DEAD/DEAH box helicase [Agrobacterium tumefaciens]|uniref:DEAD/DEAH box helicase n=1 Tax=Agrobacterium tumefaciens TaxID=358 RepID=UPI00157205F8|nr:DEAD/DEAH box helicase [Agrobacterium tumefaciens]NSY99586.1 DEAD/DEAH box helicase [Agrobacterium tumefaciens]NSZ36339.1 DEAD/DEAH box helicase [Agrobacterium tumefaciens]NTB21855.1 DEAD/DEAH box helicase [Agrobacterium tumefaciens]NTB31799.1 DEAD/DEAH box helicase [Agrobacterium tumefaciens]NTB32166.1 DEAD/DEAH box helicase [Agrobacterium tumefaciens]